LGVQDTGSIVTREGRLITFPNILQHQAESFELEDKTKPGHRRIVAFFLIDPDVKIFSTAKIPCQRQDWWEEELERTQRWLPKPLGEHSGTFPLEWMKQRNID